MQQILSHGPGLHLRQAIAAAHPYPEGRWLFVRVDSEEDIQEVHRLMALRIEEKRLK